MEKITVKVDPELYKKMNERMIKKGCKTISQCGRELIDLGIKIEEKAALYEEENVESDMNSILLEMLKTNMIWVLESRFLLRKLTLKSNESDSISMKDFMKKAKERAENAVTDLMQNPKRISSTDDSE